MVCATVGLAVAAWAFYVLSHLSTVFPNTVEGNWEIWISAYAPTKSSAIRLFDEHRATVEGFLRKNGLALSAFEPGPFSIDQFVTSDEALRALPRGWHGYVAQRSFRMPVNDYARFARLSNTVRRLDPAGLTISSSFPEAPFRRFALTVAWLTAIGLCLSVVSLESREADVNHAPLGMHPVVVAWQTLLYAGLFAIPVIYVHLLADTSRLVFELLMLIGLGSLGFWLVRTRFWWNQRATLRICFFAYVLGALGIVAETIWALKQPMV
jgi:hypothetical protein